MRKAQGGKKTQRCRSVWREFEFIFTVVRNAIVPIVKIEHLIENWDRIKKSLAEGPRKRVLQSENIKSILQ